MLKVKIGLFAALLVGIGAVMLLNEIGIGLYPPAGVFPDGKVRSFHPADVRSCMGVRVLAAIGDRISQRHWDRCATTLAQTQALAGFDLRYWSLVLAGAFSVTCALGIALTLRFDRPPALASCVAANS